MNTYQFRAELWVGNGKGAWYFVTMPSDISKEMRALFSDLSPGFGSIAIKATIGKSEWQTSVFYDTKIQAFLLPIKSIIRKKETIHHGDMLDISIEVIV